jgi:Spy/CpxP family protein refolding chaperone
MRDNPDCGESRANLDALTRLLTDRNDAVVAGAAAALGSMGSSARSAVPALQRALKEVDAQLGLGQETMLPSQSSDQAIRDALRKITGRTIPDYNEQQNRPESK